MMNDVFSLKGRTALVTGGTRGIGRMIAQGFLEQGAKVYISGRSAERAEAAARELSAFGPCIPLAIDAAGAAGSRMPQSHAPPRCGSAARWALSRACRRRRLAELQRPR